MPDGGFAEPGSTESGTTVVAPAAWEPVFEGRAVSHTSRSELDRRQPRSSPDALRFEPGVFVQQSAHGQGSAFVRGLTGQQTLLLFDGIRLNNSTYRQGPNQYLFTVDLQSVEAIEVQRGGASTHFGSDALGGVIALHPLLPPSPTPPGAPMQFEPRVVLRGASADRELGGRAQLSGAGRRLRFAAGAGARRAGQLEASGPVLSPVTGTPAEVPRFAEDGRTQLGTGFRELTADGRVHYALSDEHELSLASYVYRQLDAPRADQCPPPAARYDECLRYEEQFRTLVYGAWDGRLGTVAESIRTTLSWQQQHERRRHERPASFALNLGRDDVDTWGIALRASTAEWRPDPSLGLRLRYGADSYFDTIHSRQWTGFTDLGMLLEGSRGQYLSGSTYLTGGSYAALEARFVPSLAAKLGSRLSWISAHAPTDAASGTTGVERQWMAWVGFAGLEWSPRPGLTFLGSIDRSFRAPNLDDLTSRQQTGPGFQFENPLLQPERATAVELGGRLSTARISAELWLFRTLIDGALGKLLREAADCPPESPQCRASWYRYQLVNAPGTAELRGLEAAVKLRLVETLSARAVLSWTWGEGPNLIGPPEDPSLPYQARVPLSRVPPLNGSAELSWSHPLGLGLGAGLRWALEQRRLALADLSDPRIPFGGTPGFAVAELRASYRLGRRFAAHLVLENLFDAPYRYHGSSVNGPARGARLALEGGL